MIDSEQLKQRVAKAVDEIRAANPMAGSITNTVTIDFVANAQLAVGGSAAMVYLPDEGSVTWTVEVEQARSSPSTSRRFHARPRRHMTPASPGCSTRWAWASAACVLSW